MSSDDFIRIDMWEMRKKFNDSGYLALVRAGEIEAKIRRNKHPNVIAAWVPYCTYSQEVSYRRKRDGEELARVHQYFRPDGTLGASGLPDPKRLRVGDQNFRLESRPDGDKPSRTTQIFAKAFWWLMNRLLALKYIKF